MSPEGKRPGIFRRTASRIADIPSRIKDLTERSALRRARREGAKANETAELLARQTDDELANQLNLNNKKGEQK